MDTLAKSNNINLNQNNHNKLLPNPGASLNLHMNANKSNRIINYNTINTEPTVRSINNTKHKYHKSITQTH